MRILLPILIATVLAAAESAPPAAPAQPSAASEAGVRLKDLCDLEGVRENQLTGVGVVVGLSGTGDKSPATVKVLRQMLSRHRMSFNEADLDSRNVALVAITANLPAWARKGDALPCQVSCVGDSSSLRGGVLLQTQLIAWNAQVYAAAQGTVSVGGFGSAAPANAGPLGTDQKNIETVAVIDARVSQDLPVTVVFGERVRLLLKNPDWTTASRVARTLGEAFGPERITAEDAKCVTLSFAAKPGETELVETIAKLQQLRVSPDVAAKVVINSRTGTVVVGANVQIGPVAVSHGALSLRIAPTVERRPDPADEKKTVDVMAYSDPLAPKMRGAQPPAGVRPTAVAGTLSLMAGATVEEIVNGLNALGARPRDLVAIFEAVRRAGALHADLEVM